MSACKRATVCDEYVIYELFIRVLSYLTEEEVLFSNLPLIWAIMSEAAWTSRKERSPWKPRGTNFFSVDVSFSQTWMEIATTANTIWHACRKNLSKRGKWSKFVWRKCIVLAIKEIKCFFFHCKNKIVMTLDREMLDESVSDLRSTMCELQERLHSVDGEGE